MRNNTLFLTFVALLCLLFTSCDYSAKKSCNVSDGWVLKTGDNSDYASPNFDDSTWEPYKIKSSVTVGKDNHYYWMRKTITVPEELANSELWFGFGKIDSAFEVFADGQYIGGRGSFPPNENVRSEVTSYVHIPATCIHDGKVSIALRAYAPQNRSTYIDVYLGNTTEAQFTNDFRAIFNQQVFLVMAILCLFICFYSISEFIGERTNLSYIYYALSLFFISIYFFDIGTTILVAPYNVQRAFVRSCLPISMNFMVLFLMAFFNKKQLKKFSYITYGADVLTFILYFCAFGNGAATDNLFLFFLLPIFAIIVYGITVTIKELRNKTKDTLPLFIGFILGSSLAVHDIVCMIIGYNPFMWLQGFSFFFLNIAIFITVASHSARLKRQFQEMAIVTSSQKDKLTTLFENAKKLSAETSSIVASLNLSVDTVANAAEKSADKVTVINGAISKQKSIREETAKAVNGFAQALSSISKELEQEAATIQKTAEDTNEVIKGIDTVGAGISNAAQFASSLTDLTRAGSSDMRTLSEAMDKVQNSSKEILSVASALDDFAQQTDLLAMNASIEAAHAGEFGKGFAVIAHEIKALASQSSQRSAKIGEIVQSISQSVDKSVELSSKVNTTLGKIQNGALQSAEKVASASEGMKIQQLAGAKIAEESTALAKSASHMKDEAIAQNIFSQKVLNNMTALELASNEVDKANTDISEGSVQLKEQSRSLTELAKRTQRASQDLEQLMQR